MSLAGSVPAALLKTDWRFVVLAGAATGLLASSLAGEVDPPAGWPFLIAATVVGLSLVRFAHSLLRSAGATTAEAGGPSSCAPGLVPAATKRPASRALRLAIVGIVATLAGLWLGADRIAAIDRGAVAAVDGRNLATLGFVTSPPRTSRSTVSFPIHTPQGNLLVRTQLEIPELPVGREVAVQGTLSDPEPWRVASLRRHGIAAVLDAQLVELTGVRRSGLVGRLDQVRDRAEMALERGMAAPEAALARGFVLGQDDRIDPRTVDDFKRSGLAHLLAVSGQNVLLLALLAMPILAALRLGPALDRHHASDG